MKPLLAWMLLILAALILLSGCAPIIPLQATDPYVDVTQKSMILMRVVSYNEIDPVFVPKIRTITVTNMATGKKKNVAVDYLNPEVDVYDYCHYWVGIPLPPGDYLISKVTGYTSVALTSANFSFGAYTRISVPPNSVVYGGIMQISNRNRMYYDPGDAMLTALVGGWETTLISSLAGFIQGYFEVKIIDNNSEDIQGFQRRYPALAPHSISVNMAKR